MLKKWINIGTKVDYIGSSYAQKMIKVFVHSPVDLWLKRISFD